MLARCLTLCLKWLAMYITINGGLTELEQAVTLPDGFHSPIARQVMYDILACANVF